MSFVNFPIAAAHYRLFDLAVRRVLFLGRHFFRLDPRILGLLALESGLPVAWELTFRPQS